MVKSNASTVQEYLDELPPERREVVSKVRQIVLDNLPAGYVENMGYGMISYEIPLEDYPNTYNDKPLTYLSLAAQKNHYALYLMGVYQDSQQEAMIEEVYRQAGMKLDMGKSCLRFQNLEGLHEKVVAEVIASTPPESFIARYEASRKR
jgi:hypothetical protein